MEFKLSKYIILSDTFQEKKDLQEFKIIYSCRKKMGIKIHSGLEQFLLKEQFKALPDNIFSMLMHYEIIIPKEENEALFLYNFNSILHSTNEFLENENAEPYNQNLDLNTSLDQEKIKLKQLIQQGQMQDFLENNDQMSLLFIDTEKNISIIPLDRPYSSLKNESYINIINNNNNTNTYLLPINYLKQNQLNETVLEKFIDNLKLKLLLKYKINTRND